MGHRSTKRKPFRKVTSAEDQQERAELAKYRASLRRIQETERLMKKLHRAQRRVREELRLLAVTIIEQDGNYEIVSRRAAAVNE